MSCLYAPLLLIAICFSTYYIFYWRPMPWWLAYLFAVNLVTFIVYAWDKLISPWGNSPMLSWLRIRVPEWVLFWLLSAIGGSFGAWLGIGVTNHKTGAEHEKERAGVFTIFLMQTAVLIWTLIFAGEALKSLSLTIQTTIEFVTTLTESVFSMALGEISDLIDTSPTGVNSCQHSKRGGC